MPENHNEKDVRCPSCSKKLAEKTKLGIEIKCDRCKEIMKVKTIN